jgi:alkaline phosphatase D
VTNGRESANPRREFLRKAGTTTAIAGFSTSGIGTAAAEYSDLQQTSFEGDPFTLGVASGDPLPDSVVLWTRLATAPLEADGGMPDRQVSVQWEMATEGGMNNTVAKGSVKADPEFAHSVHIDVKGLKPNTKYYYRFKSGSHESTIGETKTAPRPTADVDEFRFAFASCQSYSSGYYTAYQHMAEEDLDLVVHLGDYIYEGRGEGKIGRPRKPPRTVESLDGYRIRYAQNKTDPHLQATHAAFPWIVTWDDHEVANNYADDNGPGASSEEFLERRADAYQAFFEHMPLRPSRMPDGPNLPLYRRFTFGNLAKFHVLDTRQYRDDITDINKGAQNPERTILGDEQEDWLISGLQNSTTQWNILANQILMASIDVSPEWWDGYPADRQTVLNVMAQNSDLNPIVITGDIHRNYAYNLKADFSDPDSETVGTEYVGTSITSFGDGSGLTQYGPAAGKPWQRFFNDNRGYVRCVVTPDRYRTDYRVVSTIEDPTASVRTLASYLTESGNPGAQLASKPPEQAPIEITRISRDVSDDDNSNIESVKLQNTGETPVDLSGFMVSFKSLVFRVPTTETGVGYAFDDFVLEPGETVTIRNETGEDTQSIRYTGEDTHPARAALVADSKGLILDEEVYPSVSTNSKTVQTETDQTTVSETADTKTSVTPSTGTESTDINTTRTLPSETTARIQTTSEVTDSETSATTPDNRTTESEATGPGFGILAATLAGLVGIALRRLQQR